MAFGRKSRFTALLSVVVALAPACASATDADPSGEPAPPATDSSPNPASPETTTTTTTAAPLTTVTPPTTTTTNGTTTTGLLVPTTDPEDLGAEILIPEGDGPFPAVVLVHGGGWVAGDPSVMADLARYLTENGFITVNAPYQLAEREASFPAAVDDVACAVRLASSLPGSSGTVTVLGHSAGAHLSALVALAGESYGADCPYPDLGGPDALVGLAGPYDVDRLGLLMVPFFGGGPNVEPDAWEAGNPMKLVANGVDFASLIMFGDRDALVDPSFALDFHQALVDAGADSTLELVEGARHMDLRDPASVGDLIVVWLERER